jgi:hypothetical protein
VPKKSSTRRRLRTSKRLLLIIFTSIFSLASVGIMEDFQTNPWLKTYLLLGLLLWGNLFIYLSFYPHWGQRLLESKNDQNKRFHRKNDSLDHVPLEKHNEP